jgi:UDP-N-acetylmuramate dehydrogenase
MGKPVADRIGDACMKQNMQSVLESSPQSTSNNWTKNLRGRVRENVSLKDTNWFQVGGNADFVFKPEDVEDLAVFMREKPADLPVTVLGVGSNIIVRDSGIEGVVVKLGRNFAQTEIIKESHMLRAGAAMLDVHVATLAADYGISGLEFLSGVPGTIGGAVKMNAGAYGSDIAEVVMEVEIVLADGTIQKVKAADCGFSYRHSNLPEGSIVTSVLMQGIEEDAAVIHARMSEIQKKREETQPIRSRTGGSTFKNPEGKKAWELIDAAGCRGLKMGGAQVSEKHCNFLINAHDATAADLEALGDAVIQRVFEHSGIMLEWEIKRIGKK